MRSASTGLGDADNTCWWCAAINLEQRETNSWAGRQVLALYGRPVAERIGWAHCHAHRPGARRSGCTSRRECLARRQRTRDKDLIVTITVSEIFAESDDVGSGCCSMLRGGSERQWSSCPPMATRQLACVTGPGVRGGPLVPLRRAPWLGSAAGDEGGQPCPPLLVSYGFLSARRGCVLVVGVCLGGVVGGQVGVAGHGDRAFRVLR